MGAHAPVVPPAGVGSRHHQGGYCQPLVGLVVALATLVAYMLYTVSAETRAAFGTSYLAVTGPFTLLGLLRFYQLVTKPHQNASPTDEMLRDLPFIANVALWGVTVLVVIYL